MPFASKRQWRAAFAGKIPGLTPEDAEHWAQETTGYGELPERADKQKGEPTMRAKKAVANAFAAATEGLAEAFKAASLGTAVQSARNVGKLRGLMTTNALKAPGYSPLRQTPLSGRGLVSSMSSVRPQ